MMSCLSGLEFRGREVLVLSLRDLWRNNVKNMELRQQPPPPPPPHACQRVSYVTATAIQSFGESGLAKSNEWLL